MKVVVDTNVLISGIGWSGAPKAVIDAWKEDEFIVIATEAIVAEYQEVAAYLSKKYPEVNFEEALDELLLKIHLCEPVELKEPISVDPDDDKFIACALSANAKIIVSGDSDLLEVDGIGNINVLRPKDFMMQF